MRRVRAQVKQQATQATRWTNSIVRYAEVPPADLIANPANWRMHPQRQRDVLDASLATLGWIVPVIVNTETGHLIDGHARVEQALAHGAVQVPVVYVRLTIEQERLALATFDPITSMAGISGEQFEQLMQELVTSDQTLATFIEELSAQTADQIEENRRKAGTPKVEGATDVIECPSCGHQWQEALPAASIEEEWPR